MPDLLNIGTSGLLAFQRALSTVSHNISNVYTDGYSRQRTELATRWPMLTGAGAMGQGVNTISVTRAYDEFLTQQVRFHSSNSEQLSTYYDFASEIDNLLADADAGLAPTMEEFFAAVQDVANDPTSTAARSALIASGETLSSRFQALDQRLTDMQSRVNREMEVTVGEINSMAESIAKLNQQIADATGAMGGQPPNDLLDKRDLLLEQLSAKVSITALEQDDGMMNVFVGTGQALVVGVTTTTMAVTKNSEKPEQLEIRMGQSPAYVTDLITGGNLGGLIEFQNDVLDSTRNALGQIGAAVALTFNEQHHLGMDLNNNLGGDFFDPSIYTDIPTQASSANSNLSTTVNLTITSASSLTADDFRLEWVGGAPQVTRVSDGQVMTVTPDATVADRFVVTDPNDPTAPSPFYFDVNGAVADGDSFYMRPTYYASMRMGVVIDDPTRVAAASPVRGETLSSNLGSLEVGNFNISESSGYDLPPTLATDLPNLDLALEFDSAGGQFNVTLNAPAGYTVVAGSPLPYDPDLNDGTPQVITLEDAAGNRFDINFSLSGRPEDGDDIQVSYNANGFGDNQNALALAQLQIDNTMLKGTADYQTVFAEIVAEVGTRTHAAEMDYEVANTLYEQAVAARSEVSGVNLDEEAADLLKYQQAYMASTKMISVADTLFQTLLGAVGS